jgi:hypothetical protein
LVVHEQVGGSGHYDAEADHTDSREISVKGIILNLVEEAVTAEHGEPTWDALLDSAQLDGAYTSLGNYPDEDLGRLITAGAQALDVDAAELTRHLGHLALVGLAARYPRYFEPYDSTRPFLVTVNKVIHTEVRKLHPDTDPPDFWFDESDPDVLLIHYRSARRLCTLAEGMIAGAATHYREQVELTQDTCMLQGADRCTFHASFRAD